jgi:hypothetical protein
VKFIKKQKDDKELAEQRRHNVATEKKGSGLKKEIQSIIKQYSHALSNSDIEKLVKVLKIKNFKGVFMTDELPKTARKYECSTVNLDISDHVGTHWICYFKNDKVKYVFDAFGSNPSRQLVNYLGPDNLYYERIQDCDEYISGHLCIIVLKLFSDGYDFNNILDVINATRYIWA